MADIDPDIILKMEKEFRTLSSDTLKYRRSLKSSIETIARGTKSRKEQNKIIDDYKKSLDRAMAKQIKLTGEKSKEVKR